MNRLFKYCFLAFSICFSQALLLAQSPFLPSYSLSVEPTIGNRLVSYKGNFSQHFKDSIQKADRSRDALSFAFMVSTKFKKNQRFSIGLQFQNLGFTRQKDNLHFLDTIHPGIGVMNDLSQTGGAYVDFNYRYQYIAIPLLFSRQISSKKKTNTTIHLVYGGSLAFLMKHDIRAVLHGFSTRGNQKIYHLKNPSEAIDRFNVNLHGGLRIENMLFDKSTWVFAQTELILPTLSANSAAEKHHLWAIGVQVGIYYIPQFKEDKK